MDDFDLEHLEQLRSEASRKVDDLFDQYVIKIKDAQQGFENVRDDRDRLDSRVADLEEELVSWSKAEQFWKEQSEEKDERIKLLENQLANLDMKALALHLEKS